MKLDTKKSGKTINSVILERIQQLIKDFADNDLIRIIQHNIKK